MRFAFSTSGRLLFLACSVMAIQLAPAGQTSTASFQGLGQMPGSPGQTYSNDISGDGQVVVGHAWLPNGDVLDEAAFRWTATGGYENLGHLGGTEARAHATNLDGSVVVGYSLIVNPGGFTHFGFRWTAAGGMEQQPIYEVVDVSEDGTFWVGQNVWRRTNGETGTIGFLGGNNVTQTRGVSADGQVVVGWSETSPNRYAHAFRWTLASGIQDLGVTSGTESIAEAISPSGLVIVGQARDSVGFWRAFRWTASLGMRDLGSLGGR